MGYGIGYINIQKKIQEAKTAKIAIFSGKKNPESAKIPCPVGGLL
jgi:hypothetical protein